MAKKVHLLLFSVQKFLFDPIGNTNGKRIHFLGFMRILLYAPHDLAAKSQY